MSEYRGGDPGADTLDDWEAALAESNRAAGHTRLKVRAVLDDLVSAVARVRALHGECGARCGLCHECGAQLPCATLRALDGV